MNTVPTTRISKYVDSFEKMEYAINGFEIYAQQNEVELTEDGIEGGNYSLRTWHNGNHVETEEFETIQELVSAMKAQSGDLRVWKVVR